MKPTELLMKEHEAIKQMLKIMEMSNIDENEISELLNQPQPIANLANLTEDERFEYLYMVIQLMKIDGQVFKSEIVFCEEIAEKLGFKKKVVAELSKYIYSDPSITSDRQMLRNKASKYMA